jgi:hypothetical protein
MHGAITKLLGHPVVPIIVGFGIAMDGPGNILVRSAFIAFCGFWLCYDLATLIYRERTKPDLKWRNILFVFACSSTSLVVMASMYWLLHSHLEDQQEDVYRSLTAYASEDPNDVMESVFTFNNGGKTDIGTHQMFCSAVAVIFQNYIEFDGGKGRLERLRPNNIPIKSGGDGESAACLEELKGFEPKGGAVLCADVVVGMDYELSTEPGLGRTKKYRFVFKNGHKWHQQGVDYDRSYCPLTR